jgi:hypothetical protein
MRTCLLLLLFASWHLSHLVAGEEAAAAKPVEFTPGCLASIFVASEWPIKSLPEAPTEVLRLAKVPVVEPTWLDEVGGNTLVQSKLGALKNVREYAVVFDGFFFAKSAGKYGFTVQSDDPFQVFIEGNELKRLHGDFSVEADSWTPVYHFNGHSEGYISDKSTILKSRFFSTLTDAVTLGENRWYRLQIVCKQRWWPAQKKHKDLKQKPLQEQGQETMWQNILDAQGARFSSLVSSPEGTTTPLQLYLLKE